MGEKSTFIQNASLVLTSVLIGLLLAETILRIENAVQPILWPGEWRSQLNLNGPGERYTLDPEFGFRPILPSDTYGPYGTKLNSYDPLSKSESVTRLLFMGDSVTARGKIIDHLKKIYGTHDFEYWNAGVESFNTAQEVLFYRKYNKNIHPDHVILFFHNNDFGTTPVMFMNDKNTVMAYSQKYPTTMFSRWFFTNSALYRKVFFAYLKFKHRGYAGGITDPVKNEVETNLESLANELNHDGIDFTVVVLPVIDNDRNQLTQDKTLPGNGNR